MEEKRLQRYEKSATNPAGVSRRRRRKMQAVTMSDVAKEAGVSPSTVSLYLRRPSLVSAQTGRDIARAIDGLGYVPNLVAGGLAAASSRVVSIIVPSVRNAFFAQTVSTLQTLLVKEGLQVLLGHAEYSQVQEEALVRTALSWAPAAVILSGLQHSAATRRLLSKVEQPVIEMWELGGDPIDSSVGFLHPDVGASAARHLLAKGRRQLAFIGARMQEDHRAMQRANGFADAASRAGAACEIVNFPAPASTESGAILLGQALARMPKIEGLACSNDTVALGALFECQRRGIAVPQRLSIIGFGDLEFSGFCNPSLTTIRPSGDLIGQEVARLLLRRLKGEAGPAHEAVDTGFVLVERNST